jgi:methyl-accepting chemotaxis protein
VVLTVLLIKGVEMNTTKTIQRRQLVVDPKFQYGLIIKFVILVTIILIASLALLAFVYTRFANIALPVSVETGGVVSFGATQFINLSELIWPVMLFSAIISGVAICIFGLYFSHKMAGPVYRLRNDITEMTDGDLERKVSLREKDYFQLLATDINCLRQHWHDSILEMKTINKKLNDVANGEQKELLDRFNRILSDLLKTVS